jgi:hypothetical protein
MESHVRQNGESNAETVRQALHQPHPSEPRAKAGANLTGRVMSGTSNSGSESRRHASTASATGTEYTSIFLRSPCVEMSNGCDWR